MSQYFSLTFPTNMKMACIERILFQKCKNKFCFQHLEKTREIKSISQQNLRNNLTEKFPSTRKFDVSACQMLIDQKGIKI